MSRLRWVLLAVVLTVLVAQRSVAAVYVLPPTCDKPWWWLDPNCWF